MQNKEIIDRLKRTDLTDYNNLNLLFETCRLVIEEDLDFALETSEIVKNKAASLSVKVLKFFDLYNRCLLFQAPYIFDSYLLYLEKNRQPKDKFYLPKRRQFKKFGLIQSLQDLEDDVLDIVSISMPPGTQKTTLEKFFASWVIGRHPDDYSLFFSHSGDITRMFFDGVLDITTNTEEYAWNDIFPTLKLLSTDAKRETINFNKYKPFANLQCTSVGSKNAGKVRCNKYLYCDDLIGGIEEALSKDRLEKLWSIYGVDAKQRKIPGCKELHIATRWSVGDVIGKLKNLYQDGDRARFISIKDIDEETGKSNFDYDYNGFSVEFFNDQELSMDDVSYRCLYKNEPIEREGLLYHPDDLRRYFDLPGAEYDSNKNLIKFDEADAVLGICDTKDTGTDFEFLPIVYQYGEDFYLEACLCDNAKTEILDERCADILVKHKVKMCRFESNNAGGRTADVVQAKVKERKGITHITKRFTTSNKETKIIVNSPWVKQHVLFKDKTMYEARSDYGKMMNFVVSYSLMGKNKNDDVPDGLAQLALFIQSMTAGQVTIFKRPC